MPKSLPKRKRLYQKGSSHRLQLSSRRGSAANGVRSSGQSSSSAPELISHSYIEKRETKFPARRPPKPLPVRRSVPPTFSIISILSKSWELLQRQTPVTISKSLMRGLGQILSLPVTFVGSVLGKFIRRLTLISTLLTYFKRFWRWYLDFSRDWRGSRVAHKVLKQENTSSSSVLSPLSVTLADSIPDQPPSTPPTLSKEVQTDEDEEVAEVAEIEYDNINREGEVSISLINQHVALPEQEEDVGPNLTLQILIQPQQEKEELEENQQHSPKNQELPLATPNTAQETSKQALQPSVVSHRLPSIYDRQIDPPDFEQEEMYYPHIKLFPDPTQPEEIALSELSHGWHIIGASRRGYGHAYDGKYREDDFAVSHICLWPMQTVISLVAIADGVGSKVYARHGARAAVEGAIDRIAQEDVLSELTSITKFLLTDDPEIISKQKEQIFHLLEIAMQASVERVRERATYLNSQDRDLHSTLQLFLFIPLSEQRLFLASTQVGDGALFARKARDCYTRDTWFHIQTQQIQSTGNQVFPLLYSNKDHWRKAFQCEKYDNLKCILAMTDGTTDDIAPPYPTPSDPDPDLYINVESFYSMLKHTVEQSEHTRLAVALGDFLSYRKPQSYDDRTVIYIYQHK